MRMKSLPDLGTCCRGGGVKQDNFQSLLSAVASAPKERVAKPETAVTHRGEKPCEQVAVGPGSLGPIRAVAAGGSRFLEENMVQIGTK